MSTNIYETKPKRTYSGDGYSTYGKYKPFLRSDFNKRCGYCDGLDIYAGGSRGFQIDHFKPKKTFPALETIYSNLVYSCAFCNRAKWDKWEDVDGFIDPCNSKYSRLLYRNGKGQILYKDNDKQGKYIHENLKLNRKRHELIWIIERLKAQSLKLNSLIDTLGKEHEHEIKVLREFRTVNNEIRKYTNLFYEEI